MIPKKKFLVKMFKSQDIIKQSLKLKFEIDYRKASKDFLSLLLKFVYIFINKIHNIVACFYILVAKVLYDLKCPPVCMYV